MKHYLIFLSLIVFSCAPKSSDDKDIAPPAIENVPLGESSGPKVEAESPENDVKSEKQVTVERVIDGDTFWGTSRDGEKVKVRFFVIDAPERSQDFGKDSGLYLRQLIGRQQVFIRVRDYHGDRLVAQVFLGTEDVGLKMVQAGWAWHYKYFSGKQSNDNRKSYSDAEKNARSSQLGLWGGKNPEAPWDYRKRN